MFERAPNLPVKDPPPPPPAPIPTRRSSTAIRARRRRRRSSPRSPVRPVSSSRSRPVDPLQRGRPPGRDLEARAQRRAACHAADARRLPRFSDLLASDVVDLAPRSRSRRARAPPAAAAAASSTHPTPRQRCCGADRPRAHSRDRRRTRAHRFGTDAATSRAPRPRASAAGSTRAPAAGKIDVPVPSEKLPPLPPPAKTEPRSSCRGACSSRPTARGLRAQPCRRRARGPLRALAHRLGVRARRRQARRRAPERPDDPRDLGPRLRRASRLSGKPQFGFTRRRRPASRWRTEAGRPVQVRMSLQQPRPDDARARDLELPPQAERRRWTPPAVPTNRLMLTSLGGWLDSRRRCPDTPGRRVYDRGVEAPRRARARPRGARSSTPASCCRSGTARRSSR